MIELIGVSKLYDKIEALRKVSFSVKGGEFLTIVGPNGSGKTTLLKILAFLERPTEGEVYFGGVKVDDGNETGFRRRSTMVFQKTVLLRGSVRDNIAYGLEQRGLPRREIEERINEAIEILGLSGLEMRDAGTLSGGEQQRLSLARALALRCDLLLLDEPTANLDPESLSVIKDTLSWLNGETETTIVMATHNILQAEELSDRFMLLKQGEIVEVGGPDSLRVTPSKEMAKFSRVGNIFNGVSHIVEGISHIDLGRDLVVKAAFSHSGRATILVRPEDIIISKSMIESSARNQFKGRIIAVEDLGPVIRLKVDAGRVFSIQITRRSLLEMELNLDSEVYLSFKASSVQII